MAERKNTGVAFPDAKRLNDCYHELSEAIAARPAAKGDRDLWQYDYAALPGGPEGDEREAWNHRCGSNDVALVALRSAVTNGNLQLWTYGPNGEAKVDRYELKELTFRTFKSGTYQPDNRLIDCGLADKSLWVKEADWRRFLLDLWAVRYGIDWDNPAPAPGTPLLPSEGQFVTLSHALTWIGLGVSMGNDHLHEVLSVDRYGEHDPQEAIRDAVTRLADLGSGGRVAIRGKYRSGRYDDEKTLLTEAIEPIRLTDYRQFSYLDDELRHGEGLLFWRNEDGTTLDYVVGDGRKDSYLQVTVNRADLLREFRPHGPMGWEPEAIHWSDLDPPSLARAKELAREAGADEWWNWPQAMAWVGGRSLEHIATMRLCAEQWRGRDDHQFDVVLGAERYLAQAYCATAPAAEDELQRTIERGAIRTLGRATVDSPSHELKPLDWRGGKVVYNRTATLVSASNLLSEWACDVAVNRSDLWREFRADGLAESPDNGSKGGRPPEVDWDTMKRLAEDAVRAHPDIRRSRLADSLVAEYAEKVSVSAPVKRTVERKLVSWNMGATKPLSS